MEWSFIEPRQEILGGKVRIQGMETSFLNMLENVKTLIVESSD